MTKRQTYTYAVTWEAPTRRAAETVRGTVVATSPAIACRRAVAEASRGKRRYWDDIVVLIERLPAADACDTGQKEAA